MIPRVIVCEEYPEAAVRLSSGKVLKLRLSSDKTKLDFLTATDSGSSKCILYIPFMGMYVMNDVITPLKTGDVEYLYVILDTRRVLKVYELQIRNGKVSTYIHAADDTIMRGYVKTSTEELNLVAKRLLKKLVRQYLLSSISLCSCLIKFTCANSDHVERELSQINKEHLVARRVRMTTILYRPGMSIIIRRLSTTRVNVSLICSITYADKFLSTILKVFDLAHTILDFRLGRIEPLIDEKVSTVLDVYVQSLTARSSLGN